MYRIASCFLAGIMLVCFPVDISGSGRPPEMGNLYENAISAASQDVGYLCEASEETVSGNNGAVISGDGGGMSVTADQLYIDGTALYEGMDRTYEQGYIPRSGNGSVSVVLPLTGQTYDGKVSVTVDLGETEGSPFVFGNYSQTAGDEDGVYVFRFEIPLITGYANGTYPVKLTAGYLNTAGNQVQQTFIIYVTITDGVSRPASGTDSSREAVETPKLFISACEISPGVVGGEEEFTVDLTIENIGAIRARSVILTYGSDMEGIIPARTNNQAHLDNIAGGKSETASIALKTTKDVLAGNQSFYIKLDYADLFGGIYTETRTFLIQVTQPAEVGYDPVSVPEQVTSGETFSVPVSVFNTGKSTLRNVSATLSGAGLFPLSSTFFGDILPGQAENGEMEIYAGTLSLSGNTMQDYGKTEGTYRITYTDDSGESHSEEMSFSTEILPPVSEEAEDPEEKKSALQWWGSVLAALAVIAIMASSVIVIKLTRAMRIKQ